MRTPARPRLPDGDCVFISGARIVARANVLRHRCRHGATGMRSSMHPCAYCLPGFETLNKFEFRNRGGPNDGLGRPQYLGSFAIVYAEHEVVFLQSDQADRVSGTWIDIPLHMNPLMRANGGLQGHDRAGSAWGSERGRASPCAGLGIRSSRWAVIRGSGVRICPASIMLSYTLIPSPCSCGIPRACRSIRGSRGSAWR